eukprot:TRINITY_DN94_c5_g1_i1.p1 TRINITY_DN94_c5_g1~~TRINITY_DN94_c5_g1_i1.p1  ORF type:complete len:771 (+),score=238.90 TRINITY_DN94_c5_g1_i1:82-2394(+)
MAEEAQKEIEKMLKGLMTKKLSVSAIRKFSEKAMSLVKYYKHVVYAVERRLHKAPPNQRATIIYAMDGIVRTAQGKLGKNNPYSQRFSQNLHHSFGALTGIKSSEKDTIGRMLKEWAKKRVFSSAHITKAALAAGVPYEGEKKAPAAFPDLLPDSPTTGDTPLKATYSRTTSTKKQPKKSSILTDDDASMLTNMLSSMIQEGTSKAKTAAAAAQAALSAPSTNSPIIISPKTIPSSIRPASIVNSPNPILASPLNHHSMDNNNNSNTINNGLNHHNSNNNSHVIIGNTSAPPPRITPKRKPPVMDSSFISLVEPLESTPSIPPPAPTRLTSPGPIANGPIDPRKMNRVSSMVPPGPPARTNISYDQQPINNHSSTTSSNHKIFVEPTRSEIQELCGIVYDAHKDFRPKQININRTISHVTESFVRQRLDGVISNLNPQFNKQQRSQQPITNSYNTNNSIINNTSSNTISIADSGLHPPSAPRRDPRRNIVPTSKPSFPPAPPRPNSVKNEIKMVNPVASRAATNKPFQMNKEQPKDMEQLANMVSNAQALQSSFNQQKTILTTSDSIPATSSSNSSVVAAENNNNVNNNSNSTETHEINSSTTTINSNDTNKTTNNNNNSNNDSTTTTSLPIQPPMPPQPHSTPSEPSAVSSSSTTSAAPTTNDNNMYSQHHQSYHIGSQFPPAGNAAYLPPADDGTKTPESEVPESDNEEENMDEDMGMGNDDFGFGMNFLDDETLAGLESIDDDEFDDESLETAEGDDLPKKKMRIEF